MKRLQNRIAEGWLTLPAATAAGVGVWLAAGLFAKGLWPQLACFAASVYLLVELSNQNALLRVRSRMVSSTFIILSCAAPFLMPHLTGSIMQLCFIAAFLFLFQTYQDPLAVGRTFYAFLCLGLGSLSYVHVLWYVPALWVLMATQLQSLSGRTWMASLIGLATPYWFALLWLMIPFEGFGEWSIDLSPLGTHFLMLGDLQFTAPTLSTGRLLVFVFTLVLAGAGMLHFWQYSFEDKIRIRLLYGFFTSMTVVTTLFILLQPQHYDVLMRLAFVTASPLIAHVLTFTNSRISNILFFLVIALALALTVANLFILES